MNWQTLLYLVPYLISLAISTAVGGYAWRHRDVVGARPYALVALSQALWTLGYVFELISPGLEAKIFWDNVQWLGALAWSLAFPAFALEYTGRKLAHPRRTWGLLAIVPLAFMLLVATDGLHGLIRPAAWLAPGEPFPALVYDFTVATWIFALYGYGLFFAGAFFLVRAFMRPQRLYQGQVAVILIGNLIPLAGTMLTLAGIAPARHRDMSPFTFALGNLVVVWGLFRYRLFDLVPVARDAVVESMGDAVVVLDAHNRVVDLNPTAQALVGRTASEAIGQPATLIFSTWPHLVEQYREVEEASAEITVGTGEGRRYVDLKLSPLRDRRGQLTGRLVVVRDITARKQAEGALQKAYDELECRVEERTAELDAANASLRAEIAERVRTEEALQQRTEELEALRRAAAAVSSTLDLDEVLDRVLEQVDNVIPTDATKILFVEGKVARVVRWRGYDRFGSNEAIGRVALPIADMQALRHMQETGQPMAIPDTKDYAGWQYVPEMDWIRSYAAAPIRRWEQVIGFLTVDSATPGFFHAGHADRLQIFADQVSVAIENARLYQDLQDRMEELRRTQAQLVQAAKMAAIGQLAAGVAHEINNPMTGVMGFADLLLHSLDPDDPARENLDVIIQEARRVRDIVRNLLNFSRQTEPQRQRASISEIVQETLALVRSQLEKRGVIVEEHYAPDLPLLWLDPDQMRQVVLNLVTNAMHATPRGGTLTVTCEREGDQVGVRVVDTGSGMPTEIQPYIFEPFFTTKPIGQGTGLGLSISRGIVEEHGGRIEVQSQEGKGSAFTVWLPVP